MVVILGVTYLVRYLAAAPEPLNAITLNIVNLAFLLLGFLLHRTPARLMQAVQTATPASFPALVAVYSTVLGIFVLSGGSKWVTERRTSWPRRTS